MTTKPRTTHVVVSAAVRGGYEYAHARQVLLDVRRELGDHWTAGSAERGRIRLEADYALTDAPVQALLEALQELYQADSEDQLGALTADVYGYRS